MSFISSIQSVLRKITVSPKKVNKENRHSLLEPPFLPIPCSPEQKEVFYTIDESFTSLSVNNENDLDKTYYENDNSTMYISDVTFFQKKSASKRKRSMSDMEVELGAASISLTNLTTATSLLVQYDNVPNYSPPAKRAPILRRFRPRLATPPYRPPAVPPLNEDDDEPYVTGSTILGCDQSLPVTTSTILHSRKCA